MIKANCVSLSRTAAKAWNDLQSVTKRLRALTKKFLRLTFQCILQFWTGPRPSPLNNVAFGEITFTVEVTVLLENIIMAVINIVLGGKRGIKSKQVFCPNNFVTDCSMRDQYLRDVKKPAGLKNDVNRVLSIERKYQNTLCLIDGIKRRPVSTSKRTRLKSTEKSKPNLNFRWLTGHNQSNKV